jgi:RNA polymerase sigma-70 factor (ECF subfamily)
MTHFTADEFTKLLHHAQSGSADALGRLLEPYRDRLARHPLASALRERMDPAEIVQETFQSALRRFNQFRGATEPEWRGWLEQILRNQALNFVERYRHTQKRGPAPLSIDQDSCQNALRDLLIDDDATPYTSTSTREASEIMGRALGRLKLEYQEVIHLRYTAEKSFADIAALWDKTPEAVMKTWKRALLAWRRVMEEMGLKDSL